MIFKIYEVTTREREGLRFCSHFEVENNQDQRSLNDLYLQWAIYVSNKWNGKASISYRLNQYVFYRHV